MAEWKKFTLHSEQIKEISGAVRGWIARLKNGKETRTVMTGHPNNCVEMTDIAEYLICEPHPHRAMIKRWIRTGQPVYARYGPNTEWFLVHKPSWNPLWQYSFNPPKEPQYIEVRDYLILRGNTTYKRTLNKGVSTVEEIEKLPVFSRWLDDDWRLIEI